METELSLSYGNNFIKDIGDYFYIKYYISFSIGPEGDNEEEIIDIIVSKNEIYLKYMNDLGEDAPEGGEDREAVMKEWILDLVRTIEIDQMYFLESIFTDSCVDEDNNNTVFSLTNETLNLRVKFDNTDGELINIWKEESEANSVIDGELPALYFA